MPYQYECLASSSDFNTNNYTLPHINTLEREAKMYIGKNSIYGKGLFLESTFIRSNTTVSGKKDECRHVQRIKRRRKRKKAAR